MYFWDVFFSYPQTHLSLLDSCLGCSSISMCVTFFDFWDTLLGFSISIRPSTPARLLCQHKGFTRTFGCCTKCDGTLVPCRTRCENDQRLKDRKCERTVLSSSLSSDPDVVVCCSFASAVSFWASSPSPSSMPSCSNYITHQSTQNTQNYQYIMIKWKIWAAQM